MARYLGPQTRHDELTRARDSAALTDEFLVEPGLLSFGTLDAGDPYDPYLIQAAAAGVYRLVISNDPANRSGPGAAWESGPLGVVLVNQYRELLYRSAIAIVPADGDAAITFYTSGSALWLVGVQLAAAPASYVVTLEQIGIGEGGVEAIGTEGVDVLGGGSGANTLRGLGGDDFLVASRGGGTLDGGAGYDYAVFENAGSAVIDLSLGIATYALPTRTVRLVDIEGVIGSLGPDRIIGDANDNEIDGNNNDDEIFGGAGNDRLSGGSGRDRIDGGEGIDTLVLDVTQEAVQFERQRYGYELRVIQLPFGHDDDLLHSVEFVDGRRVSIRELADFAAPVFLGFDPASFPLHLDSYRPSVQLRFDEQVEVGTGPVTLRDASGRLVHNFQDAGRLGFGGVLGLSIPLQLTPVTNYVIEFSPGSIVDRWGNANEETLRVPIATRGLPLNVSAVQSTAARESDGAALIKIDIVNPQSLPVRVAVVGYATAAGSATPGSDFYWPIPNVTIAPGATTATLRVPLFNDRTQEAEESNLLRLTVGVVGGPSFIYRDVAATARLTIQDDDDPMGYTFTGAQTQKNLMVATGIGVTRVWPEKTGHGVLVAVLSTGIGITHPDLQAQMDLAHSQSFRVDGRVVPYDLAALASGTAAAGVIAAAANAGFEMVGVAPGARLMSLVVDPTVFGSPRTTAQLDRVGVALTQARTADVLEVAWPEVVPRVLDRPLPFHDALDQPEMADIRGALNDLAAQGRGGLGTVLVTGTAGHAGPDMNLYGLPTYRSVLLVRSADADGVPADDTVGSAILVAVNGGAAFGSGGVLAPALSGSAANPNFGLAIAYNQAAPMVAGVIALMLEANPALGWRDVHQLLAYGALRGNAQGTWLDNGARDWNGGGLHVDAIAHTLGFGLVDARTVVRLAESWQGQPALTSSNAVEQHVASSASTLLTDRGPTNQGLLVDAAMRIEKVEVTVDIVHPQPGQLALELVSPSGTASWLLRNEGGALMPAFTSGAPSPPLDGIHTTFSSVLHWGEHSVGGWTLRILDQVGGGVGTLRSWSLTLFGSPADEDDQYVYTDEYASLAAGNSSRTLLRDSAGHDVFNAAALSTSALIDLTPGATGRIGGKPLTIAADTWIEDAWGGDGGDMVVGNALANWLHGARGDDKLTGGAGDDRLDGGPGIDTAMFTGRRSDHTLLRTSEGWQIKDKRTGALSEGQDHLVGIERLAFEDISVALDLGPDASAWQVAMLLRALLGPTALATPGLAGTSLRQLDGGVPMEAVAQQLIDSPEFVAGAGARSNRAFVEFVYRNVVGSPADSGAVAYYTGLLDNGTHSQLSLALLAARHELNTSSTELTGLATTGLEFFTPT